MKSLHLENKRNWHLQKPLVDIIAITISSPLKIGIYENKALKEKIEKSGKTSDILPEIMNKLLKKYDINSIIYAKGPGSYMAIKLSFLFFNTLKISNNIKLLAADGFEFNNNQPIKAAGNSFFVKKEGIITLEKNKKEGEFLLPKKINLDKYSEDISPLYVLSPV